LQRGEPVVVSSPLVQLPDAQLRPLLASYEAAIRQRRWHTLLALAALLVAVGLASISAEISPMLFFAKIGNFTSYIDRLLHLDSGGFVWTDPVAWYWGLGRWLRLLGETLLMAYVGTALGAGVAFFLCFLAAANTAPRSWLRMAVRRFCELCRTVPDLVFALIFVIAFGLGPVPGVLALAVHCVGALGKLFAEVIENIDMKPVEGLSATGASWIQIIRFAVLPQVLPVFVSYTLLRFEINVREATVLGFVGAGGIGMDLLEAIRKFYYSDVSAILLMIVITVATIDTFTGFVRHRLIGPERR